MSNNTIVTDKTGQAKLTWKVISNDGIVPNVNLDSLKVVINDQVQDIDTSKSSYEFEVNADSEIHMEAEYEGVSVKTNKMIIDIVEPQEPETPDEPVTPPVQTKFDVYYGSPCIGEGLDWDEEGDTETMAWISSLNQEFINILVDSEPISKDGVKIANPGKLVKLTNKTSATGTYNFYNADSKIEWGQPVLIYPKSFGEMKKITDSMGSSMSINSNDKFGFYKAEIVLNEIPYLVYIQKNPNSTDTTGDPLPYKFSKS